MINRFIVYSTSARKIISKHAWQKVYWIKNIEFREPRYKLLKALTDHLGGGSRVYSFDP
jgi:hypothetical protein